MTSLIHVFYGQTPPGKRLYSHKHDGQAYTRSSGLVQTGFTILYILREVGFREFLQQARTTSILGISTRGLESKEPGIYIVISTTLSERFELSTLNLIEESHRNPLHRPRPLLHLIPALRRSRFESSNTSYQTSPLSYGAWTYLVHHFVIARDFLRREKLKITVGLDIQCSMATESR
jgi:hypothetical protein